jgi:hypothetical protein
MKKHVITTTQLRGMIKEALEESMQEIALDEQITALRAKGSKRTLQETKQYRRLLEMKMEGIDELSMGDESGMESEEPRSELKTSRADVKNVLKALKTPFLQRRLGKIDSDRERMELLSAFILDLTEGDEEASEKMLMRARSWLSQHTQEVEKGEPGAEEPLAGSEVGRAEGKMLNRTPMDESRRRLVRRSR